MAVIDSYVRRIDANKTLTTRRHIHTYGQARKPGADSLFWVYNTDFPGSSVTVYFSGRNIVKLVETARTDKFFTENSYYLQKGQLLFVKNRQAYCPILTQIAAWRSHTPPCIKAADCFFRGKYYFAQDSCISKHEQGRSRWEPEYEFPSKGRHSVTVPEIFPIQAARYETVFGKALARRE